MVDMKRGESTKYTEDQIEDIAKKLRALPPPAARKKTEFTRPEAIGKLKSEIALLKERGYTLEQIAEALREVGIRINVTTLKSYLRRTKVGGTVRAKGSKSRRQTSAAREDARSPDAGGIRERKQSGLVPVAAELSGGTERSMPKATFELKADTDEI